MGPKGQQIHRTSTGGPFRSPAGLLARLSQAEVGLIFYPQTVPFLLHSRHILMTIRVTELTEKPALVQLGNQLVPGVVLKVGNRAFLLARIFVMLVEVVRVHTVKEVTAVLALATPKHNGSGLLAGVCRSMRKNF